MLQLQTMNLQCQLCHGIWYSKDYSKQNCLFWCPNGDKQRLVPIDSDNTIYETEF